MTDLYQVLGISRGATEREIRSAYRRLARLHHPDVSHDPEAGARFTAIAEAYRVLSDPELRAHYDRGEYNPRRHRVRANPFDSARQRAERVAEYKARVNRVVDEMLEFERQETRKRSEAVSVVVTLFASTFMVAVARPSTIEAFGWVGKFLLAGLCLIGLWYLATHLRNILHNFTYPADSPISLHTLELPPQPFSRTSAWIFLIGGYTIALLAGTALGAVTFSDPNETITPLDVLRCGLVYPPIAVMIVGGMRKVGEILEKW